MYTYKYFYSRLGATLPEITPVFLIPIAEHGRVEMRATFHTDLLSVPSVVCANVHNLMSSKLATCQSNI